MEQVHFNALEVNVYIESSGRSSERGFDVIPLPRFHDQWGELFTRLADELQARMMSWPMATCVDHSVLIELFPCHVAGIALEEVNPMTGEVRDRNLDIKWDGGVLEGPNSVN